MRRPGGSVLAVTASALVLLHVATLFVPGFGEGLQIYNVTFIALTLAAVAAWPWLRERRFTSLGLAVSGLVVIATSAALLYWKADMKAAGTKDWWKFWHSAWSWAFMLLFLVHTWLNRVRFLDFAGRLLRAHPAAFAYGGAWGVALVYGVVSWTPAWRVLFTEDNYLYLVSLTLFWCIAVAYFSWLGALGIRRGVRNTRFAAWARRALARRNRRITVDVTLILTHVLALGTGFLLLYAKPFLHGNGFKYVSKYWHSATSAAFIVLLAIHVGTNVAPLIGHARRVKREALATRASFVQREGK